MNQEPMKDYAMRIDAWNKTGRWGLDVNALLGKMGLGSRGSLLDVGCNTGALLDLIGSVNPDVDLYGTDVNVEALKIATERLPHAHFELSDGSTLPYPSGMFNYVTLVHTLGHTLNMLETLKEVKRVLKHGGVLGVLGPNSRFYKWMRPYNLFTGYVGDTTIRHEIDTCFYGRLAQRCGFTMMELSEVGDRVWWLKYAPVRTPRMLTRMVARKNYVREL